MLHLSSSSLVFIGFLIFLTDLLVVPWGDGGKKVQYLLCFAFFPFPLSNLLILFWLNTMPACYFKIQCLCMPYFVLLVYFLTSTKWASIADYYLPCSTPVFLLLTSQQLSCISQSCATLGFFPPWPILYPKNPIVWIQRYAWNMFLFHLFLD